jgi:predicted RecA/RadA family phage recombinase
MARLDDNGQWIVLMGIMVSVGIFFLAFIINQATLVGQTTAEGVLEFPKNEIQDTRSEIFKWASHLEDVTNKTKEEKIALKDISTLARYRRNAEVWFDIRDQDQVLVSGNLYYPITIHYNNGVTEYEETLTYFVSGS